MQELLSWLPAFVVFSRSRYNGRMSRAHSDLSLFSLGLFLSLVVFVAGCQSKDDHKYPADHARFERIVEMVETLRSAYEEQNLDAIKKLMLPLQDFQRIQSAIQRDFATYSAISLATTIERIYIQEAWVRVNVRWEGEWQRLPEETLVTGRGHGILVWSGTEVLLLAGMEGDLPFGMASR